MRPAPTGKNYRVLTPLLAMIAALAAVAAATRRRRADRRPARAVIVSPRQSTVIARDGAVRSVQSAELTMATADLDPLWSPTGLENLGRTYWRFLSRVTLGLIRVVYGNDERVVVLLARPLTLLRFDAPEYDLMEADHGMVRWRIRDGLLVSRSGRGSGFLSLDVRRRPADDDQMATVRIEVEVANFYPSIASGLSTPVYEATQSNVHVFVTHAFLRSLAKLRLAESKVGRFARVRGGGGPTPQP